MDIMYTLKRWCRAGAFVCCLVALAGPVLADGKAPWKLAFSLNEKTLGEALPTALHVDDEKKRYYMVDSAGGQLASFDEEGRFLQTFRPEDGLLRPFDMVRISDSILAIVEKGKNVLTLIDFAGKETRRLEIEDQGRRLVIDRLEIAGGRLYLLDRAGGGLYRLSPSFEVEERFALPAESGGLVDFKIVGEQIWALGQQEKRIYVYLDNGLLSKRIDIDHLVSFPVSLAIDSGGLVYVLDRHQGQVVVLDRKARVKYRFLSKGHGPQHLYFPIEVRFDPWGRLCIVDEGNGRIQVFRR